MTRSTVIIGLRLGVLAGSLFVVLPISAQQNSEAVPDITAEMRELQTQRVETLKTLSNQRAELYKGMECSLHEVLAAQHALLEARLEMAETSDKRIALLESHIEWWKKRKVVPWAEGHSALVRKSRGQPWHAKVAEEEIDCFQAKTALLEIEIRLLRERGKANPGKMAETSDQLIALLESQVKLAKQKVQVAEELYRAKDVSRCVPLRETAALLGIEIELLRERARLESAPK